MGKKFFLFDLDGTLTDPQEGIINSAKYSLSYFGIHITDNDTLLPFIGPPIRDSYRKFFGFSKEQAEEAVVKYREYFSDRGIFENKIYDGIEEVLKEIKNRSGVIVLATSKPHVYAEQILDYFDIKKYFSFISGSELDGRRSVKKEIIEYVIEKISITDRNEMIMIGDRKHDIIGANEAGIESVGVLYGYGDIEELTESGAVYIAETVRDLRETILRL